MFLANFTRFSFICSFQSVILFLNFMAFVKASLDSSENVSSIDWEEFDLVDESFRTFRSSLSLSLEKPSFLVVSWLDVPFFEFG